MATSGAAKDTVHVAVMPRGTVSALQLRPVGPPKVPGVIGPDMMPHVVSMDLDLTNLRSLGTTVARAICIDCGRARATPRWTADGSRIVFTSGYEDGSDIARVTITDPSGTSRVLFGSPTFRQSADPVVARDGTWIYFAGWASGFSSKLWRARIDGTNAVQLPDAIPAEVRGERGPDLSPDGTMIVYTAELSDWPETRIHARNIATGQRTALNVNGSSPRWSPTGDLIAYRVPGELRVVRSDGSGDRRISTADIGNEFNWSPDGKFLIVENTGHYGLAVIEAATGRMVRLISAWEFSQPDWRP